MTFNDHRRPLIFQHIAKTAGSTVSSIFMRIFPPEVRVNTLSRTDITAIGMTRNDQAISEIRDILSANGVVKFVGGHVAFGIHTAFPGEQARYVTMLRRPVERAISNLYYVAKSNLIDGLDASTTLDGYLGAADGKYFLWFANGQARALSADDEVHPSHLPITATTAEVRALTKADLDAVLANLDAHYDIVGLTEQIDEFIVMFAGRYGFALNEMVYQDENVNEDRPPLERLSPDNLAAVERANDIDAAVYEWASARFQRQVKALGPAFQRDLARFRELKEMYQSGLSLESLPVAMPSWPEYPVKLETAAILGDLDTIRRLWPNLDPATQTSNALELAAGNGHVHVLAWAFDNGAEPQPLLQRLARAAAVNNRLDVLAYLKSLGVGPAQRDMLWTGLAAAARDDATVATLRALPQTVDVPIAAPLLSIDQPRKEEASTAGAAAPAPDDLVAMMNAAIAADDVDALDRILDANNIALSTAHAAYDFAAFAGSLNALRNLQRRFNLRPRHHPRAFELAAKENHLSIVRYFLLNDFEAGVAARIIDALPDAPGYLNLRQLVSSMEALRAGFVTSGLDPVHAATIGDVKALAFLLHTGRLSMDQLERLFLVAAENGQEPVLKFLNDNGVTLTVENNSALVLAVRNGHLAATKFLFESGVVLPEPGPVLEAAFEDGHLDVIDFLMQRGMDSISQHRPVLEQMDKEIRHSDPIYAPSKIWDMLVGVNLLQLSYYGLHRFKRSVNQNYLQFMPLSFADPQLRWLIGRWLRRPRLNVFRGSMVKFRRHKSNALLIDDNSLVMAQPDYWLSVRYRLLVCLLWDVAERHDWLKLLPRMREPRVGDPIKFMREGRLLSQDLANSVLEANSILEGFPIGEGRPLRIAEVGAGYGRLVHAMCTAVNCKYVVIDIPPALLVSQWYLSRIFPAKRIFTFRQFANFEDVREAFLNADLAFLTANQIKLLPDDLVDICVNVSSLHELRLDQINHMLDEMRRITRRRIYLKQYRDYENPYDKIIVTQEVYRAAFPANWIVKYDRDVPADPRFFESVIERTDVPSLSAPEAAVQVTSRYRPTVSVLLCNYNHARYLPTALTGIANQTRPADEVILVDDGSTDNSLEVMAQFADRIPGLRILRQPRNYGLQAAIARALREAASDYVVWAAADDLLLPEFLEKSMAALKRNPEAGLCFSQLAVFTDGTDATFHYDGGPLSGAAFDYHKYPEFIPPEMLFDILKNHYVWISGNTVVANRKLLLQSGSFPAELRWHSDWFGFYALALRHGACVVPETLALMREAATSYSREGFRDKRSQMAVLDEILRITQSQKYADIGYIFRMRPTLFSVFGTAIVPVAWKKAHYRIARSLTGYYAHKLIRKIFRRWG